MEEKMLSNNQTDVLHAYRQNYTSDDKRSRSERFKTEFRRSCDYVSPKFRVEDVKLFPRTPKSLEILRNKIMEMYGILGIVVTRFVCNAHSDGKGLVSSLTLKRCLAELNVTMSQSDFLQVGYSLTDSHRYGCYSSLF